MEPMPSPLRDAANNAAADRLSRALDAFLLADRELFKVMREERPVHDRALARKAWQDRLRTLREQINSLRASSLV